MTTPLLILGVDPGASGGLAFLWPELCRLAVLDMPTFEVTKSRTKTYVDEELVRAALVQHGSIAHAWIEEVGAMPHDAPAYAFAFGMAYGSVLGALGALGIPRSKTRPVEWKKAMRAPAEKKQSVARARELMPACSRLFAGPRGGIRDGVAEAAMIALFGALNLGHRPRGAILPLDMPA